MSEQEALGVSEHSWNSSPGRSFYFDLGILQLEQLDPRRNPNYRLMWALWSGSCCACLCGDSVLCLDCFLIHSSCVHLVLCPIKIKSQLAWNNIRETSGKITIEFSIENGMVCSGWILLIVPALRGSFFHSSSRVVKVDSTKLGIRLKYFFSQSILPVSWYLTKGHTYDVIVVLSALHSPRAAQMTEMQQLSISKQRRSF